MGDKRRVLSDGYVDAQEDLVIPRREIVPAHDDVPEVRDDSFSKGVGAGDRRFFHMEKVPRSTDKFGGGEYDPKPSTTVYFGIALCLMFAIIYQFAKALRIKMENKNK